MVYVVAGNGPNLMDRDCLCSVKVTIGAINGLGESNKLSEILQKHVVFTEGPGTFTGAKVSLQVDPQIKPKFFKACTIPDKVETELENYNC